MLAFARLLDCRVDRAAAAGLGSEERSSEAR